MNASSALEIFQFTSPFGTSLYRQSHLQADKRKEASDPLSSLMRKIKWWTLFLFYQSFNFNILATSPIGQSELHCMSKAIFRPREERTFRPTKQIKEEDKILDSLCLLTRDLLTPTSQPRHQSKLRCVGKTIFRTTIPKKLFSTLWIADICDSLKGY